MVALSVAAPVQPIVQNQNRNVRETSPQTENVTAQETAKPEEGMTFERNRHPTVRTACANQERASTNAPKPEVDREWNTKDKKKATCQTCPNRSCAGTPNRNK
jgi:hypothetical protein